MPAPRMIWSSRESLEAWMTGIFKALQLPGIRRLSPDGLVYLPNLTLEELIALVDGTLSATPFDIMEDLASFARAGGGMHELSLRQLAARGDRTPLLVISGGLDDMAPAGPILNDAWNLPPDYPVWTVNIKGASHIDLVYGALAAQRIVPLLIRFNRDRGSFGPPHAHHVLP
jgi:hypothetical protein